MARGKPITVAEGYAIRAMLEEGLGVRKMSQHLGRSETLVRKYIDQQLKNTEEFIQSEKPLLSDEVRDAAVAKLVEGGMAEFDAVSSVSRLKNKIKKEVTLDQVDAIVKWCTSHKSPKENFVTKTDSGRKGFAIMTEGASEVLDELKTHRRYKPSSCIYRQEDR